MPTSEVARHRQRRNDAPDADRLAHDRKSTDQGTTDPRYNTDGAFNGQTILVIPGAGRVIDPTIQQFSEVPRTVQTMLPLMTPLPSRTSLGEEPFGVVREEYIGNATLGRYCCLDLGPPAP